MKSKSSNAHAKNLAVIIPCYNEAASIARVIAKFPRKQLIRNNIKLSIYVVDNNSSDETAAIATQAGAIVIHEAKKGKGNALRTGFRSIPADTDYVAMLDGDDTYDPSEIMRIIEPLQCDFCDVVVGSRLGGRMQESAMKGVNHLGNRFFTLAVRTLYQTNVTDVLTGYFAWKKPALDAMSPYITSSGFAIEMEMITKMARLGHHLAAVPISYDPRAGESNLRPFWDGLRILSMLLRNIMWRPGGRTLGADVQTKLSPDTSFTPRKVVFVSDAVYPYMKGGKEKRLYEIAKRLAAMGHEVHIYTMHWWRKPSDTNLENGVQLHALCKYHAMYSGDRRTIREGILFGLACFKLMRVQFDVLDVDHMPFFPIFSTWVVCLLRGRRLHVTWHEALSHRDWVDYMGGSGVFAAMIERISARLPHYITATSTHTEELLAAVDKRTRHVELVASGIDTSLLCDVQPAQDACDVLYVGRLVKDKNVDKLIAAMAIVTQSCPLARCIIIGQGIEEPRLRSLAKRLHLERNVTFMGSLEAAKDVYAYMKAAKVFCSPSVREGFGITSLEALGCGTPVITIDDRRNAARHLVEDGRTGSVVALTPQALADAIMLWTSVAHKPDTAAKVAHYDWHNIAKRQAEVYSL